MGSLSDTSGKNVKPPAYMIESDLSPLNKIYKVLSIAEKTLEPYEEPFNMVEINIRGTAHNSEDLPSKLDILIARICGCKNYVQDTKDGILNTRFNYETINDIKNKIIPKFNNIEDFRIFVGYNYCRFCWDMITSVEIKGDSAGYTVIKHDKPKEGLQIPQEELDKIIKQLKK